MVQIQGDGGQEANEDGLVSFRIKITLPVEDEPEE